MLKIDKHIHFVCRSGALKVPAANKEAHWSLEVLRRNFTRVSVSEVSNRKDLEEVAASQPDLVFLGAAPKRLRYRGHSNSRYVWLSDFFETRGITYSGSASLAMIQEANKHRAKQAIESADLKTANYFMTREGEFTDENRIPVNFPLFLKPADLGSGRGVSADSVVHDLASFHKKVHSIATEFNTNTLAEQYLSGREFTVAILDSSSSGKTIAMPVELIAKTNENGDRIVSGSVKKADSEKVLAVTNKKLYKELNNFAIRSFNALSGRDYGRIDVRMDDSGKIHFLEANLRPGLGGGYFVRACLINEDMEYESVIMNIVSFALSRSS